MFSICTKYYPVSKCVLFLKCENRENQNLLQIIFKYFGIQCLPHLWFCVTNFWHRELFEHICRCFLLMKQEKMWLSNRGREETLVNPGPLFIMSDDFRHWAQGIWEHIWSFPSWLDKVLVSQEVYTMWANGLLKAFKDGVRRWQG